MRNDSAMAEGKEHFSKLINELLYPCTSNTELILDQTGYLFLYFRRLGFRDDHSTYTEFQ